MTFNPLYDFLMLLLFRGQISSSAGRNPRRHHIRGKWLQRKRYSTTSDVWTFWNLLWTYCEMNLLQETQKCLLQLSTTLHLHNQHHPPPTFPPPPLPPPTTLLHLHLLLSYPTSLASPCLRALVGKSGDVASDWQYVAMVMDRLFFILFTLIGLLSTVVLFTNIPTLWDGATPIGWFPHFFGTADRMTEWRYYDRIHFFTEAETAIFLRTLNLGSKNVVLV